MRVDGLVVDEPVARGVGQRDPARAHRGLQRPAQRAPVGVGGGEELLLVDAPVGDVDAPPGDRDRDRPVVGDPQPGGLEQRDPHLLGEHRVLEVRRVGGALGEHDEARIVARPRAGRRRAARRAASPGPRRSRRRPRGPAARAGRCGPRGGRPSRRRCPRGCAGCPRGPSSAPRRRTPGRGPRPAPASRPSGTIVEASPSAGSQRSASRGMTPSCRQACSPCRSCSSISSARARWTRPADSCSQSTREIRRGMRSSGNSRSGSSGWGKNIERARCSASRLFSWASSPEGPMPLQARDQPRVRGPDVPGLVDGLVVGRRVVVPEQDRRRRLGRRQLLDGGLVGHPAGLGDEHVDDALEPAAAVGPLALPGGGAAPGERVEGEVGDLVPVPGVLEVVAEVVEQLPDRPRRRHQLAAGDVDEVALQTGAGRAPAGRAQQLRAVLRLRAALGVGPDAVHDEGAGQPGDRGRRRRRWGRRRRSAARRSSGAPRGACRNRPSRGRTSSRNAAGRR